MLWRWLNIYHQSSDESDDEQEHAPLGFEGDIPMATNEKIYEMPQCVKQSMKLQPYLRLKYKDDNNEKNQSFQEMHIQLFTDKSEKCYLKKTISSSYI